MFGKTITWYRFSESKPTDLAYTLVSSDSAKQFHRFAIFHENYDGESPPQFYDEIDEDGNEIPLDFEVTYWAYVDFLPY